MEKVMTTQPDFTNGDEAERKPEPYELIQLAARKALADICEADPTLEHRAAAIRNGKFYKVSDLFASEALSEKGLGFCFHRFDEGRQSALLAEKGITDYAQLFEGLPESTITFYKGKIQEAKQAR
jgi:hypothetical protein